LFSRIRLNIKENITGEGPLVLKPRFSGVNKKANTKKKRANLRGFVIKPEST